MTSYRLKEIAIGYAAAKGISERAAKDEINQRFEQEIGVNLQGYLEQHRLERGLSVDNSQKR